MSQLRYKSQLSAVVLACAALMLGGCATMVSKGVDRITIDTGEMIETKIFVDDLLVGWETADVTLKRGQTHVIRVERDGCASTVIETSLVFDPASWGGISLLGIGMAADVASGNAWRVEQNQYTVLPRCPS